MPSAGREPRLRGCRRRSDPRRARDHVPPASVRCVAPLARRSVALLRRGDDDGPAERRGPDRLHRPGSGSAPAGVVEALGTFARLAGSDRATAGRAALRSSVGTGRQCGTGSIRRPAHRRRPRPARGTREGRVGARARGVTAQPPPNEAAIGHREAARRAITIVSWPRAARRASPFHPGLPPSGSTARSTSRTCSSTKVTCCSSVRPKIRPSHPTGAADSRRPLVDVASVLWSLQNAATRALAVRPATSPTDRDRLAAWAQWWVAGASHALPRVLPAGNGRPGLRPGNAETRRRSSTAVAVRSGVQ